MASRGVSDLTVVENDRRMFAFIRKTADEFAISGLNVLKMDVFKFLGICPEKFDLIFAGPPYALQNLEDLPRLIFEKDLLKPGGWFILEHTPRNDFRDVHWFADQRNYGTTVFSFFIRTE